VQPFKKNRFGILCLFSLFHAIIISSPGFLNKSNDERFGIEFPHINYEPLDDYVYIGQNRFLCIKVIRQNICEIVEFDFTSNTLSVAKLQQFPYFIWHLKRTPDGRYSFLISADNHRTNLLCFLEYP
jgi:hypothetical protein